MTHPWFLSSPHPRVLAHRGFVDRSQPNAASNTFVAVAAAHAAGAHYVESDCHLTRDGVVVLFHDSTLASVTGDPRKVADVTAAELETLLADRGGLITLEQALDTFPHLKFNLDAKVAAVTGPMARLIAPHTARVLVSSFSDARRRAVLRDGALAHVQRPASSAGTSLVAQCLLGVTLRIPSLVRRALSEVDALQIPEKWRGIRVLTPRLIHAAHRLGVEVHVWTVDSPADIRRLIDLGVDGIISDRTDVGLRVLAERD